jgi:hypothetical protein
MDAAMAQLGVDAWPAVGRLAVFVDDADVVEQLVVAAPSCGPRAAFQA